MLFHPFILEDVCVRLLVGITLKRITSEEGLKQVFLSVEDSIQLYFIQHPSQSRLFHGALQKPSV